MLDVFAILVGIIVAMIIIAFVVNYVYLKFKAMTILNQVYGVPIESIKWKDLKIYFY